MAHLHKQINLPIGSIYLFANAMIPWRKWKMCGRWEAHLHIFHHLKRPVSHLTSLLNLLCDFTCIRYMDRCISMYMQYAWALSIRQPWSEPHSISNTLISSILAMTRCYLNSEGCKKDINFIRHTKMSNSLQIACLCWWFAHFPLERLPSTAL